MRGGGVSSANIVGSSDDYKIILDKSDSANVTVNGIEYNVAIGWGGSSLAYNVGGGVYEVYADICPNVIMSVDYNGLFSRNAYYSNVYGVDMYAKFMPNPFTVSMPDGGKIGFSLPKGSGIVRPSIVKIS